ncbi:polysaccharide deacetylase family protein [Alicyclobacillus vulcanalis]|uniref:Peptidoglycan/xylan/chitin deacetylase, PgdA/CDA1 family n=1 Tax=Alicyclobacillus vulcanalis TaxID=252246 RepID=A0A1N7KUZ8_9BACL|nr:polysaccharide deacetylase family protein [Alicyclobacillus vulcanalis]SIS65377.1 Peptidoglycan/xylan/chitin deacetylase, PgdA/CDA1 family [Alicyclobacillus vulcanalis]
MGWIVAAVIAVLVVYAGLPFVWTRILGRSCIRRTRVPGCVALTFDDGPHPEYTPRLLDVLKEGGARATFFVIAEHALKYPDIVGRMLAEGHEVQVHGYRHWFVPLLPPHLTVRQCVQAREVLARRFGIEPRVYRPTWGACNLATLVALRRSRMTMLLWSVMVGDWRKTPPDELVRRIVAKLDAQSVLVLHDSDWSPGAERGAPESVIAAMPAVIEEIRRRGYTFVLASECE